MPGEDQLGAALATKRDRILQLPPAVQERFAELIWRRSVGPKQASQFTSKEDAEAARKSFINSFLKRSDTQLPEGYGKEPVKHGIAEKAGATLAAGGAGVSHGVGNIAEVVGKVMKAPKAGKDISNVLNKYIEAPAYQYASEVAPDAARYAAGAGKTIPSVLAAETASAGIPIPSGASTLVKTGLRALKGGAAGAAGMIPFSTDPSDIEKGAGYGAVLEPIVGPLLSRKTAKPKAPGVSAVAPAAKPSGISDISETVAQRKFGKSVSELSPSEVSEHAKAVREELIARANAAKELAKTEKKVAKAGAKTSRSGVVSPKIAKRTSEQAKAEAAAQVKARAAGTPTGPGANASTTASQTVGTPASPPLAPGQTAIPGGGYTSSSETLRIAKENEAETQRLAEAKAKNIAAAAAAQNPQVAQATAAVKDFAGVPEVTKVPEGEHGKGPLGTRAKNAERKAAERAAAAAAQPSSGNVVGTEGDIGKKPGTRVSISETPTIELESDFKQLSPEAFKMLQSLKTKQKWDDAVYRGYLMEWFTRILQEKGKPK